MLTDADIQAIRERRDRSEQAGLTKGLLVKNHLVRTDIPALLAALDKMDKEIKRLTQSNQKLRITAGYLYAVMSYTWPAPGSSKQKRFVARLTASLRKLKMEK